MLQRPLDTLLARSVTRGLAAGAACGLIAASAWAQSTPASSAPPAPLAPPSAAPAVLPEGPAASSGLAGVKLEVPRPVKAITQALGPARQRLALVIGQSKLGNRSVLDTAPRDAQAVASLMRRMGFVVIVREDSSAAQLRLAVADFRERLQPGGIGLIYATGLGAQLNGQNYLLARDAVLDEAAEPAKLVAAVRAASLPMSELSEALMSGLDSPRLLVVDAAYAHPVLAKLPAPGLTEMRLPPGLVALFGNGLNAVREVAAVAPLPDPAPDDPRLIAASGFARVFVATAATPRLSGAQTLRVVRRALHDGSAGQWSPWLGGEGNDKEELAETNLVDALLPRTADEWARELAKKGAQSALRNVSGSGLGVGAGEQAVGEVLRQPVAGGSAAQPVGPTTPGTPPNATRSNAPGGEGPLAERGEPMSQRRQNPGLGDAAQQAGNTASSVGKALSTAASVGGTVAGVAASVATTAATGALIAKATEASATVTAAQAAVSTVGSLASNAAALASRLVPTGGGGASTTRSSAAAAAESSSATAARASSAASPVSRVASAAPALPAAPAAAPFSAPVTAPVTAPVAAPASTLVASPAAAPVGAAANPVAAAPTPATGPARLAGPPPTAQAAQAAQGPAGTGAPAAAPTAAGPVAAAAPGSRPAAAQAAPRSGEQSVADILNQAPPNAGAAATAAEGARRAPGGPAPADARTTRQAEGGERPAWQPRTNRFGHAEGDTLSWQVTDTWRGETRETFVASIEEVLSDGQILANGQQLQMDPQGRHKLRRGRDGSESRFEPHEDLWWADAKRGQSRDLVYTETFRRADGVRGSTEWKGSAKVGAPRTLETPAGTFEVLPIESSGWATETLANGLRTQTKFTRTVWYAPKLGHPVAIDLHDADRVGKMLRRERVELVHQQTQRLTTP